MNAIPPDEYRPGLRPPQFRLSTLLWLMAALGAVFASFTLLGVYGAPALALLILCVIAHVAGTKIGTRLRDNGDHPVDDAGRPIPRRKRKPLTPKDFAPATGLSRRHSLGLPILIVTAVGIVLGAAVGGTLLAWLNWDKATVGSIAFGPVASGILGGISGFWIGSFVHVLTTAGLEAGRRQ